MIQNMKVLLASVAVSAFLSVGANAATVVPCNTEFGDVTNNVTPTSSCFGIRDLKDGAGDKLIDLNGLNINGTGLWSSLDGFSNTGSNTYFSLDDSAVEDQAGNWSIFSAATSLYTEFMMVFKSGQDRNTSPAAFVAYILDGTSGTWTSPFFATSGSATDGDVSNRDLSNVELYGRTAPSPIPLPGAGWLLLAGLASMAAMRSRRKAA